MVNTPGEPVRFDRFHTISRVYFDSLLLGITDGGNEAGRFG